MAPWKLLAACFVVGTLAFDADAQTSKAQPPEHGPSFKGHHARNFVLRDLSGKRVSLKDFSGKPVVVNFWATWCPPCLQEMPIFEELQKKYATSGLTFLGINVDVETGSASEPKVAATAKRLGVTYPVLLSDRSLTAGYGSVPMLPETFYINRKGTIVEDVWTHTDKPGIEAHIQEIIR
jgi:thiol-disulfide isomerase/thioredoxin